MASFQGGQTQFPVFPPLMGQVVDATRQQQPDGTLTTEGLGRHSETLAQTIHQLGYMSGANGNLFSAIINGATGRTILAPAGTTSGPMIYNPIGSGINMEVLEIFAAPTTATDVVGVLGLEYGAPPTTVTNANAIVGYPIGKGATGQGRCSYGSTIVAMTMLIWIPVFIQTTAGVLQGSSVFYRPQGLVIAPGGAINLVSGQTTQSTNVWAEHFIWAEWPQ